MRNLFSIIVVVSLSCGCSAPPHLAIQDSSGQSVQAAFDQVWNTKTNAKTATESIVVKARVVIARDGKVLSAKIIQPSGDLEIDKSVQKTLDRVKNVGRFSADMKDSQKTYIISFRLMVLPPNTLLEPTASALSVPLAQSASPFGGGSVLRR